MLRKLQLVIWKNGIIRLRHWFLTICEIVIPILLFVLITYARTKASGMHKVYMNATTYYPVRNMSSLYQDFPFNVRIYYAPDDKFEASLMEKARLKLRVDSTRMSGFPDMDTLLNNYSKTAINNSDVVIMAVDFNNGAISNGVPLTLDYKLRSSDNSHWDTDATFPIFLIPGPMDSDYTYIHSGFLSLQAAIDSSYTELVTKNADLVIDVVMQKFPYPPYMQDFGFSEIYRIVLPLLTVMSFLLLCPSLLKRVVEEKNTGIKELMKMMGLQSWMLWLGWLIHALVANIPSITIIVILLKTSFSEDSESVIPHCDAFILWIFLVFYCIAGICLLFFISTWFNRPTIAMSVGEALWLMSYFIPNSFAGDQRLTYGVKILMCFLPNMALSFGFQTLANFEARDRNLGWGNLYENTSGRDNDLSMGVILIMFIAQMAFYSILTWYMDSIKPGPYGLARQWYFPFLKSFWIPRRVEDSNGADNMADQSCCEEPTALMKPGVQIRNLHKKFGSKVAVDGLTMDIYKGQITALLGHNGAGKTTTMSILTGMFSATSGTVHVDGYDIHTQLNQVRESLGLCPQHNMLFTDLTVMEHMLFFGRLKGASTKQAREEAKVLLNSLMISEKSQNMPSTLSGGMKRKLSLGIALIGKSKVLMLDEPTSGMDPEARREIWDVLLRMRGERTIIITTHFMEEADVLGDRIAIMDHGRLQCYGTSIFLKKKYGAGYQLSLMKGANSNVETITSVITKHIPAATLKRKSGQLLTFTLPTEESFKFPVFFDELESRKEELGINGIGVSITTLDEVFLRVGQLALDENPGELRKQSENLGHDGIDGSKERLNPVKVQGVALELVRFKALIIKKWLFTYRKPITFGLIAFIPIFCMILTMVLARQSANTSGKPPLLLNLDKYGRTEVLFSADAGAATDTSNYFRNLAPKNDIRKVDDLNEAIVDVGTTNIVEYRERLIVAAEFNKTSPNTVVANALYSSIALHSSAISLNMISNSVLQSLMKSSKYSIRTTNYPLEQKTKVAFEIAETITKTQVILLWVSMVPLGLLFFVGICIHFPLNERVSNVKQLQLMTGLNATLYWIACYVFDILFYCIITCVMIFIVYVGDVNGPFSGPNEIGVLFLLFLLYGMSAIPYCYMFSFFRRNMPGAFALLLITSTIVGIVCTFTVIGMEFSTDLKDIAKILKAIFAFFPHFSLSYGILKFVDIAQDNYKFRNMPVAMIKLMCQMSGRLEESAHCRTADEPTVAYLDWEKGIGSTLLMLTVDIFVYSAIILLFEFDIFMLMKEYILKVIFSKSEGRNRLDDDVVKEHERVMNNLKENREMLNRPEDILLVHDLEKVYNGRFKAVRGVSFGVVSGECFGLLGINGAGKTTTFRMLTGDEIPTSGDATLDYFKLSQTKKAYLARIGYCPQFDAINESLTGREMLMLFGQLRAIPIEKLPRIVNYWLDELGLMEYAHRVCGTYSGGNKRKLSTAMALIGNPSLVLLDEPTSGVDPISRRNLWNVLSKIQLEGQSIVLTSHSMEECEALCNRLAIMVNGQLVCVGTVQYLKQRFGQGFTAMLKLHASADEGSVKKLKETMEQLFKSAVVKDEHQGLLHYHITDPNIKWSQLFAGMEEIKSSRSPTIVEDYTISETTLEQVFLSFARTQRDLASTPPVITTGTRM